MSDKQRSNQNLRNPLAKASQVRPPHPLAGSESGDTKYFAATFNAQQSADNGASAGFPGTSATAGNALSFATAPAPVGNTDHSGGSADVNVLRFGAGDVGKWFFEMKIQGITTRRKIGLTMTGYHQMTGNKFDVNIIGPFLENAGRTVQILQPSIFVPSETTNLQVELREELEVTLAGILNIIAAVDVQFTFGSLAFTTTTAAFNVNTVKANSTLSVLKIAG